MIHQKLAVVCAAGGTSCSYCGGALAALAAEHRIKNPDYIIAASGSAATALYYLTGQYDSMHRIWTEHVCSPRFLSFLRFTKMLDVDYLIDTVIRNKEPLNLEKLAASPTRYFFSIKNATTGQGRYLSCEEELDVYEALRATKALPFFYGRKVTIDGEPYVDSAFNLTKEDGVIFAAQQGATHILLIETNNQTKSSFMTLISKLFSKFSSGKRKRHDDGRFDIQIIRMGPDKNPAPPLTRNPALLSAAYLKGYEDMRDHSQMKQFLSSFDYTIR